MPTVFIIQDPEDRNIEPARKFGDILVILSGREPTKLAAKKIMEHLNNMEDADYLLLLGSPLNIGIAMHVALSVLTAPVQVLIWDRKQLKYNVEKVEIE